MKLRSLRTWLVVAAGVLLLAGGVVLYTIKNPPLPPGWEWHEVERYRVALPPGLSHTSEPDTGTLRYVRLLREHGRVSIYSHDLSWMDPLRPEEVLDNHLSKWSDPDLHIKVIHCETATWRGCPARAFTLINERAPAGHETSKHLAVLVKDWMHVIIVDLAPGEISEEDADFVFRSFRPK